MTKNNKQLRDVLNELVKVLSSLSNTADQEEPTDGNTGLTEGVCTPKAVPISIAVQAAQTAVRQNPVNAPAFGMARGLDDALPMDPLRIAVMTQKYWGSQQRRLSVSFMETTPRALRDKIISHLNAWNKTAGISFVYTQGVGNVRISRGSGGYYSYVGTDILHIAPNRQTMNLQGFTLQTSDAEYRRVVRHEAGHTLGFPHEHMRKDLIRRLDRQKCYAYFARLGWNKAMVDSQVLTPLDEASIFSTDPDQTSIMCYQLPGTITKDGKPILGGADINDTDYWFAGKIYPKVGSSRALDTARDLQSADEIEAEATPMGDEDEGQFVAEALEL